MMRVRRQVAQRPAMRYTMASMTAVDRAYEYTKERILDGRFPGGVLLSEGDVSANVGTSRTPVREAFLRLESEGLLRIYPKRGVLVVPTSPAEVESVMEARMLLERFAIEQVVARQVDLAEVLDEAVRHQQELVGRGDDLVFVELDRAFHRTIMAATGNFILLEMHEALRDRQRRMAPPANLRDGGAQRIVDEHREMADAIKHGDCDSAIAALANHSLGRLAILRRSRPAAADGRSS
jgi:DNA-binding GntR family transcriptional regulator